MISTLLPNHATSIYKEMKQVAEEKIATFDVKKWLKSAFEDCLEEEIRGAIGVDPYERGDMRKDQRNGFYERSLDTVYGWIHGLSVPRLRNSVFQTQVFEKYARREKALNKLIVECYWRGVSTRDVKPVLKALSGVEVSSTSVSRLTNKWQKDVMRWHSRKIKDEYLYLFLDGVWIKNRSLGNRKRLVLVAYGIRANGKKEIIDYQLSVTEKQEHWEKFLNYLKHRGLCGKNLKLIVTDGCHGLWNALDMIYPEVEHQLCLAHKVRNVLKKVKKDDQKDVHKDLKKIFDSKITTKTQAERVINKWKAKWRKTYSRAVKCWEQDEERVFNYFNCPLEHHKAIRTTNHIERQFKELRRRMRPQELIPNKFAADKMLYALIQIRNEKLENYPLQITQN